MNLTALVFALMALLLAGPVPAVLSVPPGRTAHPAQPWCCGRRSRWRPCCPHSAPDWRSPPGCRSRGRTGGRPPRRSPEIDAPWPAAVGRVRGGPCGHPVHRRLADLLDRLGGGAHPTSPGPAPDAGRPVGRGGNRTAAAPRTLRVLDSAEPIAYCLPGLRQRVVLSEGTLANPQPRRGQGDPDARALAPAGPARPGPRGVHGREHGVPARGAQQVRARVRATAGGDARRRLRSAGHRPDSLLARALVACAAGRTPSGALAAGGPSTVLRVRRLGGRGNSIALAITAYLAAAAVLGRAHGRAGGAVAHRTTSTIRRIGDNFVEAPAPQQNNERPPYELV